MDRFKKFWHSGIMSMIFISGFGLVSVILLISLLMNSINSINLANAEAENEELLNQIEEANQYKNQYEEVKTQLDEKNEEYIALDEEYAEYKESMAVYEELSEEEAKNKTHEEKVEREEREREEEERKEQEEEERKAEEEAEAERQAEEERKEQEEREQEEAKGYETGITFEDLARNPDDNTGEKVKFQGRVLQVMEDADAGYVQVRLAVNGDYDSIVLAEITDEQLDGSRILEDDEITVMGVSFGLYEYTATLGQQITIPAVIVDQIER